MKALAGLLCILLAGCATPQSSSPSPSLGASITFDCSQIYCSDAIKAAVLTAVAGVGYPVKTVSFGYLTRSCPVPPAPPCLYTPGAYVTFVGTDKMAELRVGTAGGGPEVASVVVVDIVVPGDSSPP
jgi:hypothetical protein